MEWVWGSVGVVSFGRLHEHAEDPLPRLSDWCKRSHAFKTRAPPSATDARLVANMAPNQRARSTTRSTFGCFSRRRFNHSSQFATARDLTLKQLRCHSRRAYPAALRPRCSCCLADASPNTPAPSWCVNTWTDPLTSTETSPRGFTFRADASQPLFAPCPIPTSRT